MTAQTKANGHCDRQVGGIDNNDQCSNSYSRQVFEGRWTMAAVNLGIPPERWGYTTPTERLPKKVR